MTSDTYDSSDSNKKETKPFPPVLKSTVASLALRKEPRVENSTLIRYIRPEEIIIVIETDNPQAKIGVKGQWLHVRAEGGTEGYVAAWFVERF
jgi:hypothetical protein